MKARVDGYVANHATPDPVDVAPALERLDGDVRLALLLPLLLLAVTGARISEVCSVQAAALDPRTGCLALDGKTGRPASPASRRTGYAGWSSTAWRAAAWTCPRLRA